MTKTSRKQKPFELSLFTVLRSAIFVSSRLLAITPHLPVHFKEAERRSRLLERLNAFVSASSIQYVIL